MNTEKNEKLDQLIELVQFQFIMEAKKLGMSSTEVRKILNISNNKLFRIWKLIKINVNDNVKKKKRGSARRS